MLMPKKMKFRKMQRGGPVKGPTSKGAHISFGSYAIKAMSGGMVSARQIEASRRAMSRYIARGGKIWIRVFPDMPMTKKGAETPMGKGKGSVDYYVAKVRAGRILFEMDGVTEVVAKEAMRLASHKLSVKTRFIRRHTTE